MSCLWLDQNSLDRNLEFTNLITFELNKTAEGRINRICQNVCFTTLATLYAGEWEPAPVEEQPEEVPLDPDITTLDEADVSHVSMMAILL